MDHPVHLHGSLKDTTAAELLSSIIKSGFSECRLILISNGRTKRIHAKDNCIRFIYSGDSESTLFEYLKVRSDISGEDLMQARSRSEEKGDRLGKALIHMGLINYRELWEHVTAHQMELLESALVAESGEFSISEFSEESNENITLDLPIAGVILEQIRERDYSKNISSRFEMVEKVYVKNRKPALPGSILPFESHVLNLCLKYRSIERIIAESELTEADTLKYLYYLFLRGLKKNLNLIRYYPLKNRVPGKELRYTKSIQKLPGNFGFCSIQF